MSRKPLNPLEKEESGGMTPYTRQEGEEFETESLSVARCGTACLALFLGVACLVILSVGIAYRHNPSVWILVVALGGVAVALGAGYALNRQQYLACGGCK